MSLFSCRLLSLLVSLLWILFCVHGPLGVSNCSMCVQEKVNSVDLLMLWSYHFQREFKSRTKFEKEFDVGQNLIKFCTSFIFWTSIHSYVQ